MVVQRQTVVGDDHAIASVEDAPHREPLAGHRLQRAVQVRVTEVRGSRMGREHRLLGADDPVALRVDVRVGDEFGILPERHRKARRLVLPGVGPASVRGHASYGDEVPAAAGRQCSDTPQPAVHGDDHVPARPLQRRGERLLVVRVGVEVRDVRRGLGMLVQSPVQDRDVMAARNQPPDDRQAGRPGAADDENPHACFFLLAILFTGRR